MSSAYERTPRGFLVFARIETEDGLVVVAESSRAGEGAHVWMQPSWADHTANIHLDVPAASRLAAALRAFVDEAEAGRLTEPA